MEARMKLSAGIVLTGAVLLGVSTPAFAKTEIQWWHAMTAVLGERVNEIAVKFNASQNEYEVKAVYKGSYPDTLNAAIAAYRAKQPPHIVQVFEVGTQTMLSSGAVYPVFQLMKDHGIAIDWNDLIGPVKSYYSTGGNLYSMAFNSSTPILFYNKDLFKKAGLGDKPPARWDEVEAMAKKLVGAGVKCGFSAAWPSWTLVENMHALHDQPFADHANGFDGLTTRLQINGAFGLHREPGVVGGRHRLPATDQRGGEGDGVLRALPEEPAAAYRHRPDARWQDDVEQPGHSPRQLRFDPRRHRGTDGKHLQRQEDGDAGAGRRRREVERDPQGVRRALQVRSGSATCDEALRLPEPVAALRAGGTAGRHHDRLLLLARLRLAPALALPRLTLR